MAPEIAAIAAPRATVILAGLLETQRGAVTAAFAACGVTLEATDRRGDWSILRLAAGAERYVPSAPFDPKGRDGWALDFSVPASPRPCAGVHRAKISAVAS